jgi:hypothetical protein
MEVPGPPGGDDDQGGVERHVGQLEPDLVVALPVAPWDTPSAFSRAAISTCRLAMSGRPGRCPTDRFPRRWRWP